MKKLIVVLSVVMVIISCSDNKDRRDKNVMPSPDITIHESPAGDSCAEPYLFTDKNGIVYLSWIEKIGKQSTLKF